MNDGYIHSVSSESERCEQPAHILIPLRAHQCAILKRMEDHERALSTGWRMGNMTLYSRFAILGDGVGVGKSLMVLGHIARLKTVPPIAPVPYLTGNSSAEMYSLEHEHTVDVSEGSCLVVVPHTLFRQWQTYMKEQTDLKPLFLKTKSDLVHKDIVQNMKEADVILVSNTLYGVLQNKADTEQIQWKRVFFDEADTLHIASTQRKPNARFTWFISASWPNLLFPNYYYYMTQSMFQNLIGGQAPFQLDPQLRQQLERTMHGQNVISTRYYVVSGNFFRPYLSSSHPYRGRLVLRCREDFVKESIQLPPITIRNILCRPSVLQQVVSHAISPEIRSLLHAGDIQGALSTLGVKEENSVSLVEAVTENRIKELERLRKTYDFKASMEYSSLQVKEAALKNLKQKIEGLEEQIRVLKERIENYKNEMCPICFDEPQSPLLTPCCTRIFCAACILTSLTRIATCPLCRGTIPASGLRSVGGSGGAASGPAPAEDPNQPKKKTEQLLNILKAHPDGRFLVFSRYDNPFTQLTSEIEALQINVRQVKGNKDAIAATLKAFQKGDTRVLLLNSLQAGAGLNITAATHVILLHAMNHEEEKQILGRAYRLGRTEPLDVVRLLHPDELMEAHATVQPVH